MTPNGKVDRAKLAVPVQAPPRASAEPRDDLERSLAEIWKRLLGLPHIGIDDNFFELGGHSLLAAMLAGEVAKLTRRHVRLAALFRAPTIASLATLLRLEERPAFSHLVELRPGTDRPLFVIHGMFGNILEFHGLVQRLRTKRPIVAVQARGVDLDLAPHTTIVEMADAYIEAIRARQPVGPYAIAGYSFGGLIAYEIACKLAEAGEHLDLLALIETAFHGSNLPLPERLADMLVRLSHAPARLIRRLKALPIAEWPGYLASKFRPGTYWYSRNDPMRTLPADVRCRRDLMTEISMRGFIAYRPRFYPGRVSVFRLAEPALDACNPLPILRRLAPLVEVSTIHGTHGTVMEKPHVDILAQQLNHCLTQADTWKSSEVSNVCRDPLDGPRSAGGIPSRLSSLSV